MGCVDYCLLLWGLRLVAVLVCALSLWYFDLHGVVLYGGFWVGGWCLILGTGFYCLLVYFLVGGYLVFGWVWVWVFMVGAGLVFVWVGDC